MIKTIEILITSGPIDLYNAQILPTKKIVYLNNHKYEVDDDYMNKILDVICLWKEEYGYDNKIDTEEFNITIITSNSKNTIHGKGYYPSNYKMLKDMLEEIYD